MKLSEVLSQRRKPIFSFGLAVILTFTTTVSTAPSDSSGGLVLNYEPGKIYTYDYETESVITLPGTTGEESKVKLKGQALLTLTKKNDFVLTLEKFALDAISPNAKTSSPLAILEGTSSRFTTENGAIKEFYVTGTESPFVANNHRAVASILNNYALKDNHDSKSFHYESDISGKDCPTEYEITSDSTFTKRRDLNECQNRDGGYGVQFGVQFAKKRPHLFTSDTIIRSNQECTLKYNNGLLNSAECDENHKVTILSSGNSGGKAHVTAKLQFKSQANGAPRVTPGKLSSIFFDHSGTDLKKSDDAETKKILEALVSKIALSLGPNGRLTSDTAPVLLTLKSKLRLASKQVLKDVYEKVKAVTPGDDKQAKVLKLFIDAASTAGSSESITFVAELLKSDSISDRTQKLFRLYTTFADRPQEEALSALKDVLASGKSSNPKYFLTASGVAHQYCLGVNKDCKSNAAYTALVNEIAKQTQANCGASDEEKVKSALFGLQGLGNLDSLTQPAIDAISSCLQKSDRIKVQALQAYRRDPCQESLRAETRKILVTVDNLPHVRISAYLALDHCYDKTDSDAIKKMIRTEESTQVLSFIKSHRENAWNLCKKVKELDTGLFAELDQSKIKNDPRKFSNAYFIDTGSESLATNVIYSEDSFLPRILYANSSLDYFGKEYNLIEAGAHLGDLEQEFWENMYGPSGVMKTTYQDNGGYRRRPKRQSSAPTINQNEIQAFQSQVKVPERKTDPAFVFVRLFGTTVFAETLTINDLVNLQRITPILTKPNSGDGIDFTESYPLYGDELIVPTVSGLSLIIHNEGAAVMSLKYSSSFSADDKTYSPTFRPGISIANNMKMSIASEILEAGLRAETKAAAATDISFTGTLSATDDHYGVEVRFNLPKSPVQIVDASNELYWTLQTRHDDYDHLQKMTTDNPPQMETGRKCAKILPILTGVQACASVKIPPINKRNIPHFPLSGPGHVTLNLDPPNSANELVLNLKVPKPGTDAREKTLLLEIDTPGSTTNNKASIEFTTITENRHIIKVNAKIEAPTLKAEASVEKTVGTPGVNDVTFKAKLNQNDEYELVLKRRRNIKAPVYADSRSFGIIYKLPGQGPTTLLNIEREVPTGNRTQRQYQTKLDFTLNDVRNNPPTEYVHFTYDIKTNLNDRNQLVDGIVEDLTLYVKGERIFIINGFIKPGKDADTTFTLFIFNLDGLGVKRNLKVTGEYIKNSKLLQYKGKMESTTHPMLNLDFDVMAREQEFGYTENIVDIKQSSEGGIFNINFSIDTRTRNQMDIKYNGKVQYPPKKINKEHAFIFKKTNTEKNANLEIKNDGESIAKFSFSNKEESESTYVLNLEAFVAKAFDNKLEIKCIPKAEKVDILGSSQAASGPKRILNLSIYGKGENDARDERNFGVIMDLKLNGEADKSKVIHFESKSLLVTPGGKKARFSTENTVDSFGENRKLTLGINVQIPKNYKVEVVYKDETGKSGQLTLNAIVDFDESNKYITLKHHLTRRNGDEGKGTFEIGIRELDGNRKTGKLISSYNLEKNGADVPIYKFVAFTELTTPTGRRAGFEVDGFNKKYSGNLDFGPGQYALKFQGKANEKSSQLIEVSLRKTVGNLKKYAVDFAYDYHFEVGNRKIETPRLVGNATWAYRFESITNFELHETGIIDVSGSETFHSDFARDIKAGPGFFELDSKSKQNWQSGDIHESATKLKVQNNDKKIDLQFLLQLPKKTLKDVIKIDLSTTKDISNLQLRTTGSFPFAKFQSFFVNVDRKVDAAGRTFKFTGDVDKKQAELTSNIQYAGETKTADISLKLPEQPTKNLKIKYDTKARSAEATYEWGGNGEKLTAQGTVTKAEKNDFAANFVFNSPNYKGELSVAHENTDTKRVMSLSTKSSNQVIVFNYKRENTPEQISINGDLKLDLSEKIDFDGKLKAAVLMSTYKEGSTTPGKSVNLDLSYTIGAERPSRSFKVDAGVSPAEKRLDMEFCAKSQCTVVNSKFRKVASENSFTYSLTRGDVKASGEISYISMQDGKTKIAIFRSAYLNPKIKADRNIGVVLYIKPGTAADDLDLTKSDISGAPAQVHVSGIEIAVTERTYAAKVACADYDSVDAKAAELSLWFDKKNSPDKKLAIGYSMKKASVQEQGQGRDIAVTIRHHKLPREMRFTTSYRYGITSKVFELTTEIDIFKKADDKLVYNVHLIHNVPSESYTFEDSLTSKGQGISFNSKCEGIKMDYPNLVIITCTNTEKVPGVDVATRKFNIDLQPHSRTFEIFVESERVIYYKKDVDPETGGVNAEFQLPGMKDTRLINVKISKNPFKFSISTNPSSSKAFTSFWIGSTSVLGGGFGISRQGESGGKQDLVTFNAEIVDKRLEVELDWNKQDIAEYLAYVQKRGQEIENQVKEKTDAMTVKIEARRKAYIKSLRAAAQDFEPVYQWYETTLSEIAKKYNMGPFKIPRFSLYDENRTPRPSPIYSLVKCGNEALNFGAISLNHILENLATQPTLPKPEDVKNRVDKVMDIARTIQRVLDGTTEDTQTYKEKYPFLKKLSIKIREKIVAQIQQGIKEEIIQSYFPYPEVEQFLDHFYDYIEVALLKPEENTDAKKTEMLGKLQKAVEKILSDSYEFNFQQGRIIAKIPLIKSIRSEGTPSYGLLDTKFNNCFDSIKYNPAATLPPVNATAFLVGGAEYLTFDGTYGRFEKTCQYLLASDFVNKKFSIVADIESDQIETYTLSVTDHKFTVGIRRRNTGDLDLIVNGKSVNLNEGSPVETGQFIAYKDGTYIMIDGPPGVTIGCTINRICAIQVSGFYHGKLQGIFGKFNNEPHDDNTLPTGKETTNAGIFQKSWKLNKACTGKSVYKPNSYPTDLLGVGMPLNDIDTFFTRSKSSPHLNIQAL